VKDAFGRLNKAVQKVRQLSPAFPIFGRCVVHRKNYQHLCATVDTAHALNLTSISFFGLDSDSPAFGRDHLPASAMDSVAMLRILPEDLPLLAAQLDRLERDYADDMARGFICEIVPLLRRTLSPLLEAYLYPKEPRQNSYECNVPFKSAVLEPDGSVRPCWFLPSYGNAAKEGGVAAVLRKLSSVQFRAELDVHTHPVCQKCITPRVFDDHGKSRSGLKSTPIANST
jgi:radical SAM protein with 4Fe4S-binding SPASM domain